MLRLLGYLIFAGTLLLHIGCTSSSSGGDDDSEDNGSGSSSENDSNGTSDPGDSNSGSDSDGSGGNDSSGSGSTTVSKLGIVGLAEFQDDGDSTMVGAFAGFQEFDESFEIPLDFKDFFASVIGTCTVSTDTDEDFDPTPDIQPEGNNNFRALDAGDPLTITSNGNSYLEITKLDFGNGNFFYSQPETNGPMAEGLVLNIPGAEFPAFSNIPMKTVQPVNLQSPTNNTVRFDTQFTWQAGNDPDVIIFIGASSFNTSVDCTVPDTGSFEFPQETQDELGTGFFGNQLEVIRVSYSTHTTQDAGLIVFTSSEQDM